MIKVEPILNKSAEKEAEKFRNAGPSLPSTKEVSKSYVPWVALIIAAAFAAWFFFFRKKGSGTNEGVSG